MNDQARGRCRQQANGRTHPGLFAITGFAGYDWYFAHWLGRNCI